MSLNYLTGFLTVLLLLPYVCVCEATCENCQFKIEGDCLYCEDGGGIVFGRRSSMQRWKSNLIVWLYEKESWKYLLLLWEHIRYWGKWSLFMPFWFHSIDGRLLNITDAKHNITGAKHSILPKGNARSCRVGFMCFGYHFVIRIGIGFTKWPWKG